MSNFLINRVAPSKRGRTRLWECDAAPERLESRVLLSTITGKSYHDLNSNGLLDPAEPGLSGRTIYIDTNRDGVLGTDEPRALTDSSGNYRFGDVPAGGHVLRQEPVEGYIYTSPPTGALVVFLPTGTSTASNQNFGSRLDTRGTAQVTGVVYEDLNESGFREPGEPGLSGFAIYADLNGNGQFEEDEPRAVSDASGQYSLVVRVGSLYQIREDVPRSWRLSQPIEEFYFAPVFSETTVPGRNFGNVRTDDGGGGDGSSTISGIVFDDRNGNGVKDGDGEPGLPSRTVYIDANENAVFDQGEASTQTDGTGSYSLSVDAGTYIVRTVVPPGSESTAPASGFHRVTIGDEQDLGGFDFGTRSLTGLSISGVVFRDIENIGVRNPGEPGLADFRVFLDLNRNQVLDPGEPSVLSGPNGNYTLTVSVDPGFYLLRQVQRPGFLVTAPPQGFHLLEIQADTPITGRDFGNLQLGGGGVATSSFLGSGTGGGQLDAMASLTDVTSPTGDTGELIAPASTGEGDDGSDPVDGRIDRSRVASEETVVELDPVLVDRVLGESSSDPVPAPGSGVGFERLSISLSRSIA